MHLFNTEKRTLITFHCFYNTFIVLMQRYALMNRISTCIYFTEGGCGDQNFAWDYTGITIRTASGYDCQRWDRQTPHWHGMTEVAMFPDDSMDEASNYCRQYHGVEVGYLWCHTTHPNVRWEHCSLEETLCGEYQHIAAETRWPPFYRQHFETDFLEEYLWISIEIPLKFVPIGPINNIPALVQIMACRLVGAKPLSEPILFSLRTHIRVTGP